MKSSKLDAADEGIVENARILVVDDQLVNIVLLQAMLKKGGYQHLESIQNPRQVIERVRLFRPDLILLDLAMPYLDGYSVLAQLRGWMPAEAYLPVLVITADVSMAARQKALYLGARDFLAKPVDSSELRLRVYNLLQTRWLHRRQVEYNRELLNQVCVARTFLDQTLQQIGRMDQEYSSTEFAGVRSNVQQVTDLVDQLVATAESNFQRQTLPHDQGHNP